MIELLDIDASALRPAPRDILLTQGVEDPAVVNPKHLAAAEEASLLFEALAVPRAVVDEIDAGGLADIYAGEGQNDSPAPLESLLPEAAQRALFAVTMGQAICDRIAALFADNDFVLASFLDAAASFGADRGATWLEDWFRDRLAAQGRARGGNRVLGYSPGYCGWHVSAQRKLFARLEPERVGILLRQSCLMEPLKSVSGVLIDAPWQHHVFYSTYPFCAQCRTRSCQARTSMLQREQREA